MKRWKRSLTEIHADNNYKSTSYRMTLIYCIFFIFHPFSLYKSKHNISRHSFFQNKLVRQNESLSFLLWDCASVHIGPESLKHLYVSLLVFCPVLHHSSATLFESSSATAQSRRWTPGSARSLSLSFSRNEDSSLLFKWSVRVLSSSTRSSSSFPPDSASSASVSAPNCGGAARWFKDKPSDCSPSPDCCSVQPPESAPDSVSIRDIKVVCRAAFSSSLRRLLWRPQAAGGSFPVLLLWGGSPVCSIMLCVRSAAHWNERLLWRRLGCVAPRRPSVMHTSASGRKLQ